MQEPIVRTLRMIRRNAGLQGFAWHLTLFAIALIASFATHLEWPYFWPFVGWTIGVLLHGLAAIGPGQFLGSPWETERLRKFFDEGKSR